MSVAQLPARASGPRADSTRNRHAYSAWLWPIMIFLLLASCCVSLYVGSAKIPFWQVLTQITGAQDSDLTIVLREIRLPRMLLGVLVGASLGLSGAAMQGFLRNPLAEPGLMGVSGGAAFGAVMMLYTGMSRSFALALPLGGLMGAFLAVTLVYLFAGRAGSMQTLMLAGIAINSLAGAGTALALNLSPDPHAALEIAFWIMGSLSDRSFAHIALAAPIMLAGWLLLLGSGRGLNALSLGEETAGSMGIHLQGLRVKLIAGTALAVGAAVSVSGSIAFVGLMVPHMLRPFVGHEPSKVLGASALGGAILVLWADIAVRLISTGPEIKLGVLTALIGAPFFLALVFKMRKANP